MSSTDLLTEAERGWAVSLSYLPAEPKANGNIVPPTGWPGLCDNPPTRDQQLRFRQQLLNGSSCLALACGRVTDGQRLICVDVDNDKLVALTEAVLGKTISGRFGSKGIGVFVWVDAKDEFFKSYKGTKFKNGDDGIELLTRKKITVVPPSKHRKTGKRYKWVGGDLVSSLDKLQILTREQWDLIRTIVESPEVLILLAGEGTHTPMVSLCAKIVRYSDDDGYLTAVIQSVFSPTYQGEHNSDREIGRALKSAREKGFDALAAGFPDETLKRLDALNQSHCVVKVGGKTLILEKAYDHEFERYGYIYQSGFDFKNYYVDELIEVPGKDGDPVLKPLGNVWFKSSYRRKASAVVFLPDKAPGFIKGTFGFIYNLWTGFDVEASPGNWGKLEFHLKEVLCDGNEEHYAYFLRWLANCVQNPHKQGEVAVVLRGERGTGKGTFGRMLKRIFGQHYFHTASRDQVAGRFNAHYRDTVVLFADEAFFAGDKKNEGVLKAIITEDTLAIEAKFVDVTQIKNRLHIVMATNENWAVPAGFNERRFFIIEINDNRVRDWDYFEKLNEAIDGDELPAMLHSLLELDLSDFNIRDVPQTRALAEQKIHSLDTVEDWLLVRLLEGCQIAFLGWQEWVETKKLYEDYVGYTKMKNQRPKPDNTFSKRLHSIIGAESVKRIEAAGGIRVRALAFPPLAGCRERFDAFVGFATDWPEEDPDDGQLQF